MDPDTLNWPSRGCIGDLAGNPAHLLLTECEIDLRSGFSDGHRNRSTGSRVARSTWAGKIIVELVHVHPVVCDGEIGARWQALV